MEQDKIVVRCTGCKAPFKVLKSFLGQKVNCTKCQNSFEITASSEAILESIDEDLVPGGAEAAVERPTGVVVCAVLYYIGAALYVLLGLLMLSGSSYIAQIFSEYGLGSGFAGIISVIAVILIGLAVLCFFVAKDLYKGANWAMIAAIIISAIGLLDGLRSLGFSPGAAVLQLALSGFVVFYLIFNKDAKKFYGQVKV